MRWAAEELIMKRVLCALVVVLLAAVRKFSWQRRTAVCEKACNEIIPHAQNAPVYNGLIPEVGNPRRGGRQMLLNRVEDAGCY